ADTGAGAPGADITAPAALRPLLAGALAAPPGGERRFVLAVTANAREAGELADALGSLLPARSVAYLPPRETLPPERVSPRSDPSGRRLAVLRRLAKPDPADPHTGPLAAVVTPIRGLLQPIVGGLGEIEPVALRVGDTADLDEVVTRLVEIGYA